MPVSSLPEIMDRAFEKRYGVAAFNTDDDITMQGVIRAAEHSHSPLIIQISVKTVKSWGAALIQHMFTDMAMDASVPVALHLDHCSDPDVARTWLKAGCNSVLFDGSGMSFEENQRLTQALVAFAQAMGKGVEGEVVAVAGVEDGVGQDEEGGLPPIERELEFIKDTGIYCYAPPIGTAHGFYKSTPRIRYDRLSYLSSKRQNNHGPPRGNRPHARSVHALDRPGRSQGEHLDSPKKAYTNSFANIIHQNPSTHEPIELIEAVQNKITTMAQEYFKLFGSEGQA